MQPFLTVGLLSGPKSSSHGEYDYTRCKKEGLGFRSQSFHTIATVSPFYQPWNIALSGLRHLFSVVSIPEQGSAISLRQPFVSPKQHSPHLTSLFQKPHVSSLSHPLSDPLNSSTPQASNSQSRLVLRLEVWRTQAPRRALLHRQLNGCYRSCRLLSFSLSQLVVASLCMVIATQTTAFCPVNSSPCSVKRAQCYQT